MIRSKTTKRLSELLEKHINPNNDTRVYSAKEVTFDYTKSNPIRVDYMVFKPVNQRAGGIERGDFYCYEIKSCKEDFFSGHGLNFVGDYNYIVCPKGLYNEIKSHVPSYVGVYESNEDSLVCVKKAKVMPRERSVGEILLMMFRSSNRELIKIKKGNKYENK